VCSSDLFTPELGQAEDEYKKVFGSYPPLDFMGDNTAERLARVKECIANDTPDLEAEQAFAEFIASGCM
jgi:hypothetical protein